MDDGVIDANRKDRVDHAQRKALIAVFLAQGGGCEIQHLLRVLRDDRTVELHDRTVITARSGFADAVVVAETAGCATHAFTAIRSASERELDCGVNVLAKALKFPDILHGTKLRGGQRIDNAS